MKKQRAVPIIIFMIFSFFTQSCTESLPPYRDPENVFSVENNAIYLYDQGGAMLVLMNVINDFDETLDAPPAVQGTVSITLQSDTTFKRTIFIDTRNLLNGRFNNATRHLMVDAGDTLRFGAIWDFRDENNRDIREVISYHTDPTCVSRSVSLPIKFDIQSRIQIYERVGVAVSPKIVYQLKHYNVYTTNGCT